MKETKIQALFDAWLELSDAERNPMEAALREIHALSNPKGFAAIIDEASWHLHAENDELDTFIKTLSALPNHYHRAMITFLDHAQYWKGATQFCHADALSYWRKRKNLGDNAASVAAENLARLADNQTEVLQEPSNLVAEIALDLHQQGSAVEPRSDLMAVDALDPEFLIPAGLLIRARPNASLRSLLLICSESAALA